LTDISDLAAESPQDPNTFEGASRPLVASSTPNALSSRDRYSKLKPGSSKTESLADQFEGLYTFCETVAVVFL